MGEHLHLKLDASTEPHLTNAMVFFKRDKINSHFKLDIQSQNKWPLTKPTKQKIEVSPSEGKGFI